MSEVTTIGKVLFNKALPEKHRNESRELDKKTLTDLLSEIAKEDPEGYVDVLHNISEVSRGIISDYGRTASFSLKDLKLPPDLKEYREKLKAKIYDITQNPDISADDKNKEIIKTLLPEIGKIQKKLMGMDREKNSFVQQVSIGARGNPAQLMQLIFGDMLVLDHKNRIIPIPGLSSYAEGVTPAEYWAASYGSRKGFADVQFATADSGYYGKQLTTAAQRVVVTEEDCGANDVGLPVAGDDPDNVGAILVNSNIPGVKPGTEITKDLLKKLEGKEVLIRSAATCQAKEGICSKCAGRRETGSFPELGNAVGITAARAIAEPTTQMGLSGKHTGGVVGTDDKKIFGFKEINQFVQVPKHFVGAATLSSVEGSVAKVEKAPQGGHYVYVGGIEHYVPPDRELKVKTGDTVEEGDILSSGIPNPAEVVKYKGIGEGRRYFVDKYRQLLKENGVGNHRRNVEAVARAFLNRVTITEPEGFMGSFAGDMMAYDDLVRDYVPRDGYKISRPEAAVGMYLERPVLHYSIGTKVTKNMAKRLSSAKMNSILVHADKPPFEPFVPRILDIASTDKDWMTRLSGFNLKQHLLESVQKGSTAEVGGTSYVPSLVSGQEIYKNIHT